MSSLEEERRPDQETMRLFEAIDRKDVDAVREMLARGVDVNRRDPRTPSWDGATPLIWAACIGPPEMVRLLIEHGADVNGRSASGWTALMRACNGGHTEVARVLLDAGADPTARNDEGYTAMGRVQITNTELLRLLEERGGDV